jgi:hemerythrin
MQKFTWSEAFEVGVPSIDAQHKELIYAFNDLSDAIENGTGATAIKKLLTFLKYYAEWHFDSEEKCAARHVCPMAATNATAHKRFLNIVSELQVEYRNSSDGDTVARKAHEELSAWLLGHILKIDKQIGQCVQQSQAAV